MKRLPRDYQLTGIKQIYEQWALLLKVLLVMPTGAGKSFLIFTLIAQCHNAYPVVLSVKTINLVDQLIKDAEDFGLNYGVVMAGHPKYDPNARIQICSIDTLTSRREYPFADIDGPVILVIDEADQSKAQGYQDFINAYKDIRLLGATATAYNGLSHFDVVVSPITAKELEKKGVLVKFRYVVVPDLCIPLENIPLVGNEFSKKELKNEMNKRQVYGNTVELWQRFSEYRPTLCFCSNTLQANQTVKLFNETFNKKIAVSVNAKTPAHMRRKAIDDLRVGRISIILVVGLFIRGTDIPELGCLMDAAPTLILNRQIQKWGRGSRKNKFFKDCIVIDQAANCETHGHFYMERKIDLKVKHKIKAADIGMAMSTCAKCFRPSIPSKFVDGKCQYCGHLNKKIRKVKTSKEKLFAEVNPELIEQRKIINDYKKQFWKHSNLPKYARQFYVHKKGHRRDLEINKFIHFQLLDEYGPMRIAKVAKGIFLKKGTITEWDKNNG